MEPIPAYARVLGTLLGVLAVPMLGFGVLAGTISALVTTAHVHRTTTYAVADAPRLRLDVQYSHVVIEAGADGRIVVDDDHTAGSITRAAAGWAVNQARVSISHEANGVSVRATGSLNPVLAVNWSRELRVHVPARTDLDVTSWWLAAWTATCLSGAGTRIQRSDMSRCAAARSSTAGSAPSGSMT